MLHLILHYSRFLHLNLELTKVLRARQERNVLQNAEQVDSGHRNTSSGDDTENLFPHHRLRHPVDGQRPVHRDEVVKPGNVGGRDADGLLRVRQITRDTEDFFARVLLLSRLQEFLAQRGEAHSGIILRVGLHPVHGEIRRDP